MTAWRTRAAALLREPLVHFLVAGALIFVVLSGRPPDTGERRIVVDEAAVSGLVNRYVQAFRRAPSNEELDGLIRDYVRGEVYYREALRLGLDQDDEVIKKRLRNKMLAIAGAEAEATQPSDSDLQALLDKNPARYAAPPRYTLEQRYLGPDSPALRAATQAALASLKPGATPSLPGQPIPLPGRLEAAPAFDIASAFGDEFAAALDKAPVGQWSGPVLSGFGLHLVKVERREAPPAPKLADLRQRLENDWRSAAVRKAEEDNLKALLESYDVVIERPE
jgi:peptidyl-prolyl cis-trans isomerase C